MKKEYTMVELHELKMATKESSAAKTRAVRNLCVKCLHPRHVLFIGCLWHPACQCYDGRSYYDLVKEPRAAPSSPGILQQEAGFVFFR